MATFRNVHSLAHDISDDMLSDEKREKICFGGSDNTSVVWDYCTLSKMKAENAEEEVDESDEMQFEIFQKLSSSYEQNHGSVQIFL